MKFRYLILFALSLNLLFVSCDPKNEGIKETSFQFNITNEFRGAITSEEGVASLECKGDRVVLFFKEKVEDKTSSTDSLVGEIILGFQKGDTTGVFPLNEISGKREKGKAGIVTFLDKLEFDDLSAQYISNPIRYEKVEDGFVEITEWSTEIGGVTKGKLKGKLGELGNEVYLEGTFTAKWNADNCNCNK